MAKLPPLSELFSHSFTVLLDGGEDHANVPISALSEFGWRAAGNLTAYVDPNALAPRQRGGATQRVLIPTQNNHHAAFRVLVGLLEGKYADDAKTQTPLYRRFRSGQPA